MGHGAPALSAAELMCSQELVSWGAAEGVYRVKRQQCLWWKKEKSRQKEGMSGNEEEEQEIYRQEGSGCRGRMRELAGSAGVKSMVSEAWIRLVLRLYNCVCCT